MREIYKPIPNYPGYEASNLGNIKSLINKTYPDLIKDQKINSKGDSVVNIYNGNKCKPKRVCHLVMAAFMPNFRHWYSVGHKDGNKQNNAYDNLIIINN